ncbi:MAG TPA: flavin reductase family protein [Thermomicrobiales bacterium]|mgnify:CR=1 FL=1|nr:flavin reductase family protein [Thermomicrobiales bacterium]HRA47640.1 flavin reductase family protein [Thermomicrobiales bacterium]
MGTLIERPLRDALRMIAPGPVTLLTTMHKGQPNVMTASWIRAQSLSPTFLSVAIHPDRLTHEFITTNEQAVINIPVYGMMSAVHQAGLISGRDGDKLAALDLEAVDAVLVEPPRIASCAGYIECHVQDRISSGDHDLFTLEVVTVAADDESFDGFWRITEEAGQLLQHLGADRYATLDHAYQITITDPDEAE